MNTRHWITYFQSNPRFAVDSVEQCTIKDPAVRVPLAASLAIFQLGESGGGTRLLHFARLLADADADSVTNPRRNRFPEYEKAVQLFIAEEQHHADLLRGLVHHLDGRLLEKQWSNSVFRGVRSLINLDFNIQALLTAELIAEAYYGLLHNHVEDPVAHAVCGKILHDEIKHIQFHLEFFGARFQRLSPLRRALWRAQFRALFFVTVVVVWHDHRRCFRALGISRDLFSRTANGASTRFLHRLDARLEQTRQPAWEVRKI